MIDNNVFSIFLFMFVGFIFLMLAIVIFLIVATWKMYEKANKPGWAAIVPIYNIIVLFEIIGYKWYYIFLFLVGIIPVVGQAASLLFTISYNIKLAKSFGQEVGFGIGLWLLNPIFVSIIAFSKDINYVGPAVNGDIDFNDLF